MNAGKDFNPAELPLRDIHLPEPVSWWPPAPGWWILLALTILVLAVSGWLTRRWLQRRLLRQLLARLDAIRSDYQRHHEPATSVAELSVLLRRAMISLAPRQQVAALTGDEWLRFLDRISHSHDYSEGVGRLLRDAPYQPQGSIDDAQITALFTLVERTLRQGFDSRYVNGRYSSSRQAG